MFRKLLLTTVFAATATAGFAADLPVRAPAPAPFVAPPIFTWTGFYIGLNAGGSFGTSQDRLTVPATVNGVANNVNAAAAAEWVNQGNGSHNVSGFTGGLTLGYNQQFGNVVLGLEGDISYLGLSGSRVVGGAASPFGIRITDSTKSNWFGTARVRLGYAIDRALFYVTGGAAFTDARFQRLNDNTVDGCPLVGAPFGRCHAGSARFNTGWTLGGGLEYAVTNNWTVKAEYLYSDFGKRSFRTLSATHLNQGLDNSSSLKLHTLRVGVNYKF